MEAPVVTASRETAATRSSPASTTRTASTTSRALCSAPAAALALGSASSNASIARRRSSSSFAWGSIAVPAFVSRAASGALLMLAVCAGSLRADAFTSRLARDALIHDLSKLVDAQESTDWKIDRYEYEEMMPDALESVCATSAEIRAAARAELERQVRVMGGPVEEAYRRSGGDLSAVADLRFVTRVQTLLAEAMRRGPKECPFWI